MNNLSKKKFNFIGYIEKRNRSPHYGYTRILLRNVRLNGSLLFRDHVWIKESKNLSKIKDGSIIGFVSNIETYMNPKNLKKDKVGLNKVRDVYVIKRMHLKEYLKINEHYIHTKTLKDKE